MFNSPQAFVFAKSEVIYSLIMKRDTWNKSSKCLYAVLFNTLIINVMSQNTFNFYNSSTPGDGLYCQSGKVKEKTLDKNCFDNNKGVLEVWWCGEEGGDWWLN